METNKKNFLIGSKDPEMDIIEEILSQCELKYEYALKNGKRVFPNQAYEADVPGFSFNIKDTITIECMPLIWKNQKNDFIDHHEPYIKPYLSQMSIENTFLKSSIGQLLSYLAKYNVEDLNKLSWENAGCLNKNSEALIEKFKDNWIIQSGDFTAGAFITIPKEIVACAVVDHSILDAYHSNCFGITNEEAMEWRKNYMKDFFNVSGKEINDSYDKFDEIIQKNKSDKYLKLDYDFGVGYTLDKEVAKDIIFRKKIPTSMELQFGDKKMIMFYGFEDKDFDDFILDNSLKDYQDNRKRNYLVTEK